MGGGGGGTASLVAVTAIYSAHFHPASLHAPLLLQPPPLLLHLYLASSLHVDCSRQHLRNGPLSLRSGSQKWVHVVHSVNWKQSNIVYSGRICACWLIGWLALDLFTSGCPRVAWLVYVHSCNIIGWCCPPNRATIVRPSWDWSRVGSCALPQESQQTKVWEFSAGIFK